MTSYDRIRLTKIPDPVSIVLFDGVCNLCNASVRFIIDRDPSGYFHFARLASDSARRLLAEAHANQPLPDSMALVENGRLYLRSTAALRIARRLRFPWPMLWGLAAVPRPLRDWVYDWIARNRYHWFGRPNQCLLPTPERRARFLA